MTDRGYLTIDGKPCQSLEIHVPGIGPWFCRASAVDDLTRDTKIKTIRIGDSFEAKATLDLDHEGGFAGEHRARLVAGAGKWGAQLGAKPYRNDAGVRAELVAQDAAREIGETLASFVGGQQTLGVKYVRKAGTASRLLEDAARGAHWWVGFDGLTRVGPRVAPAAPKTDAIQLLEFDTTLNRATLSIDDLSQLSIGTVIADTRLDSPITVQAYEIHVTPASLRVYAWCDGTQRSPLVDVLRDIIAQAAPLKLFGKYRYRVQTLESERVNVQAVSKAQGLPDLLSMAMSTGVAGVHAQLALGAEVYVEFIAGDAADPIITGYGGRGTTGFVPQSIVIGSPNDAAPLAARQADGCEMIMPPMVFTGTMLVNGSPTPFTAVGQATTGKLLGTITGGSAHGVKIG